MGTTMTMYTIYQATSPCTFTIRPVFVTAGEAQVGPVIFSASTIEAVREQIPLEADCVMDRSPQDDPTVIETWF